MPPCVTVASTVEGAPDAAVVARSASCVSRTVTAAGTTPVPVAGTSSGAVWVPRCPDGPETVTVHGPVGTWLNVVV